MASGTSELTSDVLWAAASVYYTALFLYVALRLNRADMGETELAAESETVLPLPEQAP